MYRESLTERLQRKSVSVKVKNSEMFVSPGPYTARRNFPGVTSLFLSLLDGKCPKIVSVLETGYL